MRHELNPKDIAQLKKKTLQLILHQKYRNRMGPFILCKNVLSEKDYVPLFKKSFFLNQLEKGIFFFFFFFAYSCEESNEILIFFSVIIKIYLFWFHF